jgi:DNA polymerase-3 subunit alpha
MDGIAKIGLLKMDFLGLRTLTVISEAVKIIKRTQGVELDMDRLALDDKKTYGLLSRAQSFGIFQLESGGMRDLLKKSKPEQFEDLISILALYRPGPMGSGMLEDYIKRKRGDISVKYDHPKLEPILKETYGIIVYQEQVMQMASVLAGFTMTQADHLRRAMSKKIPEVMDKMREDFVKGCQKSNNIKADQANRFFDLIDYFSGYGFNRSHSAAYALISYQTAYLKANYPVEFMCALLTSEKDNTDKVVEYVKECEAMGITILPPDVNKSLTKFHVVDDKSISYGLLAVKNVGSAAIESIIETRINGPYTSIFDFCQRVDLRTVNRKVMESLIKCGAMDCFGAYRAQLMAVLEPAMGRGAKSQKEKASGQISFFDMGEDVGFVKDDNELPNIKEWTKPEILSFEKEILGYYVSGHPLAHYRVEIKEFTDYCTRDLREAIDGQEIKLVGLITHVKLTTTRRTNERMAILKIEDLEGSVEVLVFPSTYPNISHYIGEGNVVILVGRVSLREESPKMIASDMKPIDDVYKAIKSINVDLSTVNEAELRCLREKLSSSPGQCPVYLRLDTQKFKGVQILVGEDLYVNPNRTLMDELKELVGDEKFSVTL